jgi:hypothetical protein
MNDDQEPLPAITPAIWARMSPLLLREKREVAARKRSAPVVREIETLMDEEVELIARLLCTVTNSSPPVPIEQMEWPPRGGRATLTRYVNRALYIRDELKARGWTSP